ELVREDGAGGQHVGEQPCGGLRVQGQRIVECRDEDHHQGGDQGLHLLVVGQRGGVLGGRELLDQVGAVLEEPRRAAGACVGVGGGGRAGSVVSRAALRRAAHDELHEGAQHRPLLEVGGLLDVRRGRRERVGEAGTGVGGGDGLEHLVEHRAL